MTFEIKEMAYGIAGKSEWRQVLLVNGDVCNHYATYDEAHRAMVDMAETHLEGCD